MATLGAPWRNQRPRVRSPPHSHLCPRARRPGVKQVCAVDVVAEVADEFAEGHHVADAHGAQRRDALVVALEGCVALGGGRHIAGAFSAWVASRRRPFGEESEHLVAKPTHRTRTPPMPPSTGGDTPWTLEESLLLLELVKKHRERAKTRCSRFEWKSVVAELPTVRSTEQARHRHARLIKGERDAGAAPAGKDIRQRCSLCGKKRKGHLCRARTMSQSQPQPQPQPQAEPIDLDALQSSSDSVQLLPWEDVDSLFEF